MQLSTGQSKKINGNQFIVSFNVRQSDVAINAYAFLKEGSQTKSVVCHSSIKVDGAEYTPNKRSFAIDTSRLDSSISKIVFAVAIEGDSNQTFSTVKPPSVTIESDTVDEYDLSSLNRIEKSLILIEIYQHQGKWKVKALASGFISGILDLLNCMGVSLPEKKKGRTISLDLPRDGEKQSSPSCERAGKLERSNPYDILPTQQGENTMLNKLFRSGEKTANDLKSGILKFKSKKFLTASIAGSFMVSAADGSVDSEEKKKLLAFVKTDDALSVFDTKDVISNFKEFEDAFDFDADAGKAQALKAISKIAGNQEQSKFLIRLIIAIGSSDGDFDNDEKEVVRVICRELGLSPSEFDL